MKDYVKNQRKSRSMVNRKHSRQLRRLKRELKREANYLLDETGLNGAQNSINHALEIERDQFLGRADYERVDEKAFRGYRNGYSERTVTLGCGPVSIKMP